MATNSFGLDSAYFADKLSLVLRDLGSFKPEELARALARMARTACEEVLGEAEFAGLVAPVAGPETFNEWFLSQEPGRLAVLREDRWMLADAAYRAGKLAAAPAAPATAAQEPKCHTCKDVGIVGHSTVCPECADTWTPAAEQPDTDCEWCAGTGHLPTDEPCAHCAVKVPRELLSRHLDEIGEYAWDTYDEMRALLGKEGE